MSKEDNKMMRCSFCGKPQNQVGRLVAGPGVCICDECIGLCVSIIEDEKAWDAAKSSRRRSLSR